MRQSVLVNQTLESNTFLIVWEPGDGLDWHGHDRSAASIIVTQGELHESLDDGSERVWEPGSLYVVAKKAKHRVENKGDEPAVSVHTYSPPLNKAYPDKLELGANVTKS